MGAGAHGQVPLAERARRMAAALRVPEMGAALVAALAACPDPEGAVNGLERLRAADDEGLAAALGDPAGLATLGALVALVAAGPFPANLLVRLDGAVAGVARATAGDPFPWPEPEALAEAPDFATLQSELRALKGRVFLHLAARDLTGRSSLEEATAGLTRLAETALHAAVLWCRADMAARHGDCLREDGAPCPFMVIGMGKLGAVELNYGSDIDPILFYGDGGGATTGKRPLTPPEFFHQLSRRVVRALGETTEDGLVFRVDLRLRPEGASGAIAWGEAGAVAYYETMGDTWERAAFIKARPVAGDLAAGQGLLDQLSPFVYRRYLDFAALEGIRQVQSRIRAHITAAEREGADVKRGRGGIRAVEFFAQAQQLIHGGKRPELRVRRTDEALAALAEGGFVPRADAEFLTEAYGFLRRVEHRIQLVAEEQTHLLPTGAKSRHRLAVQMGEAGWNEFVARYKDVTNRVHALWDGLFQAPAAAGGRFEAMVAALPFPPVAADLEALGTRDPEGAARMLVALGKEIEAPWQTEQAARRWRSLVPLFLTDLRAFARDGADPDPGLRNLTRFVEALKGRSIYAAMLAENPDARRLLSRLFCASGYLSDLLARHPYLLDDLLAPNALLADRAAAELAQELRERLRDLDEERWLDAIRRFKHREVLRVGLMETVTGMDAFAVGEALARVAAAVLGAVLTRTWDEMTTRHGRPRAAGGGPGHLAVVAMGRLGSGELAYGSDLDLIFIHNGDPDDTTPGMKPLAVPEFYGRLGKRIVSRLTLATGEGVLYEVDTRLRPSGASGQLVTSLAAFERYQEEQAWTWEKQALTRARVVAATGDFGRTVTAALHRATYRPREPGALKADVAAMRAKMHAHLGTDAADAVDLKQDLGGVVDIEFVVQYLLLAHGHAHPEVIGTSPRAVLPRLGAAGLLAPDDADALLAALALYREVELHLQRAEGESRRRFERAGPPLPGGREALYERVQRAREAVRAVYGRVLGAP
jgi:glutamate-ammonia-ligase adenylyltransferase